jgi:hypothetical protein
MTAKLVGTLEGAAEISTRIWVVEATGLLSSLLPIVLIAVEMAAAVDIGWVFRSPFICTTLMGGVVEWSIAMVTSVIEEGIAEGSTKDKADKGAPPISEVVEWSAVVPMLARVAKEGSTNEGAASISGVAGRSRKDKVTSSIGTKPAM